MQKARPHLIVSPNEMNQLLRAVIIAAMTTVLGRYPTRVRYAFTEKMERSLSTNSDSFVPLIKG
ncbi:MAG TPA: type II toxin-antitoxin system PemK/MazF family toxin [Terriglobales bacterium]|nr:type II toxin-antitoxin system PemK/MazF family toxin [Terriglobales bacterium]